MRESVVEKKFAAEVKKRGGLAVKFVSPGFNGVPDPLGSLPRWKDGLRGIEGTGKNHAALTAVPGKAADRTGLSCLYRGLQRKNWRILDEIQTT